MSSFQSLQSKRLATSAPVASTSSLLRPSRPLLPVSAPAAEPAPPVTQTELERAARFGHSFVRIPLFPPASGAGRTQGEPLQGGFGPAQNKENKTGLPDKLKAGIENLSGMSMDDVRVHYHSSKPAQVQALAYTQGTEIHMGPGQEKHLAHEVWHVVQQKQGRVKPTLQAKSMVINDDEGLEREADVMGAKIVRERAVGQKIRMGNEEPMHTSLQRSNIVQRRILTIGDEDAELRYSKRILEDQTGMASLKYDDTKELRSDQTEIILGHGSLTRIGGLDAIGMTDSLKPKLSKGEISYNLVFFACNVGLPDPQVNKSLSKQIQENLTNSGYAVTIEAPKGIAMVLDRAFYSITAQFPVSSPERNAAVKDVVRPKLAIFIAAYLRRLSEVEEKYQSADDWEKDAAKLKNANWTKAKPSKTKSNYQIFIEAIKTKLAEYIGNQGDYIEESLKPIDGLPSFNSIQNTYKTIQNLLVVKQGLGDEFGTQEAFDKWVEDLTHEAIALKAKENIETNKIQEVAERYEKSGKKQIQVPSYIS
jgi:Domain of unknown function (DUF4157)